MTSPPATTAPSPYGLQMPSDALLMLLPLQLPPANQQPHIPTMLPYVCRSESPTNPVNPMVEWPEDFKGTQWHTFEFQSGPYRRDLEASS
ncbi:hypothetical protein AbraIFM66950_004183 [Aspergillus brasiliensis]|nr:hypothetical protein AbraIFM66950_004183 [Aspergillus brasiliensis]